MEVFISRSALNVKGQIRRQTFLASLSRQWLSVRPEVSQVPGAAARGKVKVEPDDHCRSSDSNRCLAGAEEEKRFNFVSPGRSSIMVIPMAKKCFPRYQNTGYSDCLRRRKVHTAGKVLNMSERKSDKEGNQRDMRRRQEWGALTAKSGDFIVLINDGGSEIAS